jgi:hypothetical protein
MAQVLVEDVLEQAGHAILTAYTVAEAQMISVLAETLIWSMRGKKTVWRRALVQAGVLPINHIAPRRRTLTPSA